MAPAFEGRVALVTDGWHGLGGTITDSLLARGASVGVGFHKGDADMDAFVAKRSDLPISLHQGSLADAEDCRRAVGGLVDQRGRLDVVVALLNFPRSGLFSTRRSLRRLGEGEWRRSLDVHLSGAFNIAQAALEHMGPAGFGRIIFVLGPAGVGDGQGHHATIRGALQALTRELSREVFATGVTVNRVSVGIVEHEALAGLPPDAIDQVKRRLPAGRLAEIGDVTRVVEFLAHPDSGYLSGQLLAVDGGLTIDTI